MLTIVGRRWFEKTNGNTYHSVEVFDAEGKRIVRVPFAYGYGNQYMQTALQELVKLGLYPDTPGRHGGFKAYGRFTYDDKNLFIVTDVARKKDL